MRKTILCSFGNSRRMWHRRTRVRPFRLLASLLEGSGGFQIKLRSGQTRFAYQARDNATRVATLGLYWTHCAWSGGVVARERSRSTRNKVRKPGYVGAETLNRAEALPSFMSLRIWKCALTRSNAAKSPTR